MTDTSAVQTHSGYSFKTTVRHQDGITLSSSSPSSASIIRGHPPTVFNTKHTSTIVYRRQRHWQATETSALSTTTSALQWATISRNSHSSVTSQVTSLTMNEYQAFGFLCSQILPNRQIPSKAYLVLVFLFRSEGEE
jgi:hypothetical protein